MADYLVPPWTGEQVKALNEWQTLGHFHPFTCGSDRHDWPAPGGRPSLLATPDGWVCPHEDCDYTQKWAHPFMAEPMPKRGFPWTL